MGVRQLEKLTASLRRRVLLTVGRAVLQLVDDTRKLQSVQVVALDSEVLDEVERFQEYGYTSHPHPQAECVVLAVGGMRQHPLIVAIDDRRYRVTDLKAGEVCLYTDEDESGSPHRITLKRGRVVEIEGAEIRLVASGSVKVESGSLTHNGTNVGDDHTHGGIRSGPGRTTGPG